MTRRRPPARRRSRRPSRRQQQRDAQLLAYAAAAAAGITLVVMVVNWLLAHWWVLVVALVLAALAGAGWLYHRQQQTRWEAVRAQGLRYGLPQLDALHHTRFEDAVRELMQRDGCRDAQRVGGRGDLGADVKATDPYGRRWVIQCKHRRNGAQGSPVGTPDLQVLNGTARQVHGADVAVIITNGRVTDPAATFARQQRLHVVDRQTLAVWAAGSRPLWELLRAVPPPRRPTSLS
ncbi:putative transmembrane restriction endonuclease [Streptomyces ambofaciens ATCC 23877]|uniref:Putative transmembrane restriction endonuclease n=1 Tax=Streptomyces ambofaciens (strain ATCC 23877 / 3486 / DSM 40053 / JCM 4204 / NBRC 12836 / NRRL B-2516) TaxID=278992 RepID=Q1RR48_STRA7|nr:restriction endonuclease [Streptomyces ambofaciens]AKZ53103.1 putative transmembrane restriction endonuclease [Streptomyces ambofaciens ATCC 23877]AKZ60657.1 putative transmembrane restriction endonuclease [Streptomyces ambofaciens ATCC 23877]CAI77966.1 putative transmembrane restriction endonuclease [Streptomyces ambofaciens ATCC 23877]CAI78240.1 putative transmembrane restriction endonuclease [Streptomyces ambofaciens ATCC 23877]CAJ87747.1 putative transmembrane restriction endonuclease [